MFDSPGYNGMQTIPEICKPDPEELLQSARKNVEALQEAKTIIFRLNDLPIQIPVKSDEFMTMLGFIEMQIFTTERRIEELLKEIDSD